MNISSQSLPAAGTQLGRRNRRLGLWIALGSLCMLGFAPVLYWTGGLLCDWAGIGFNPDNDDKRLRPASGTVVGEAADDDGQRRVRVVLSPTIDESLRRELSFSVAERTQEVVVGELAHNTFLVHNRSDRSVFVRPIHSVTPPEANRKFLMTQCFCYNDMKLKPGEIRKLEVTYGFQDDMDVRVGQALLGYRLEPIRAHEMRPERDGFDDDGTGAQP